MEEFNIKLENIIKEYKSLETPEERFQYFYKIKYIYKQLDKIVDDELSFCFKCNNYIFKKDIIEQFDEWEELIDIAGPLEQADWQKIKRSGFRKYCPVCGKNLY